MRKVTLTTGAAVVAPVSALVATPARAAGGAGRPVAGADAAPAGYIGTLKDFLRDSADTRGSRFGGTAGDIFSTALNGFSITLSAPGPARLPAA
jgi:hypothetical protein